MSYCEKCSSAFPERALLCPNCDSHVLPSDSGRPAFWSELVVFLVDRI
ncbi:MAG: hypothetical protein N3F10_03085 [Candidatus Bathyarchaeota archaeon]|nr:hypothetical protein [Candidatus Bathyarchaeota archaeon]